MAKGARGGRPKRESRKAKKSPPKLQSLAPRVEAITEVEVIKKRRRPKDGDA